MYVNIYEYVFIDTYMCISMYKHFWNVIKRKEQGLGIMGVINFFLFAIKQHYFIK